MVTNFDTLTKSPENIYLDQPCTVCYVTDSHPARITNFKRNGDKITRVLAQLDDWKVISGSEQDDTAEYAYSPNKNNPEFWFSLRKDGSWVTVGQPLNYTPTLAIGHARRRHDPHF